MKTQLVDIKKEEKIFNAQKELINSLTNDALDRAERAEKNNRFLLLIILPLSIIINLYAITRPQEIVKYIEISPWGEAAYVGEMKQSVYSEESVPEGARQRQVMDFITYLRSQPLEQDVVFSNWDKVFDMLVQSTGKRLAAQINAEKWMDDIGDFKRNVVIESVIKTGEKSYQIDWAETKVSLTGEVLDSYRMRSVITLEFKDPGNEKTRVKNPLGIWVKDYDMVRLEEAKK